MPTTRSGTEFDRSPVHSVTLVGFPDGLSAISGGVMSITGTMNVNGFIFYPIANRQTGIAGPITTSLANTVVASAPSAGNTLYLQSVTVSNGSTTASTLVQFLDGVAGAVLDGGLALAPGVWTKSYEPPIPLTSATALIATTATTAYVYVAAQCIVKPN